MFQDKGWVFLLQQFIASQTVPQPSLRDSKVQDLLTVDSVEENTLFCGGRPPFYMFANILPQAQRMSFS